jgi:hypothetical protein
MSFHAGQALLPEGATLTVTANGVRYVYSAADIHNGEIWSRIGRGDSLAFELKVPAQSAARARLDIASLQAGYRGFGVGMRNNQHYDELRAQSLVAAADLASCSENWSCNTTPANTGPGQATVALVISNVGQCSGVVLNNARGDGTPYVLTARHCQNGSSDGGAPGAAANINVYWNAVSACGATMGSIYDSGIRTQYGARTIVEQQDAWLIRLDQLPIVDAYYAGWDATGATFVGGFTPHHALGSKRQFIGWYGQAVPIARPVGSFENVHYASTLWGTVNAKGNGGGGSSGAGLFDESGRLVGTVVRGKDTADHVGLCPATTPPVPSETDYVTLSTALYGIFNSTADPVSSTGAVTLQSVLDPDHTGVLVLDGNKRPLTVTLKGFDSSYPSGSLNRLEWSTFPAATSCTASGGEAGDGWAGALTAPGGEKLVTRYDAGDTTYTVTCTDGERSGSQSVTLHWYLGTPYAEIGSDGPIQYGVPFKLRWNSTVQPCTASGGTSGDGWGGSVPPKGTQSVTETTVGAGVIFTLSCGSGARVVSTQFTAYIPPPAVTLTADATTLRVDQPLYLSLYHSGGPCVKTGGSASDGWAGTLPVNASDNPYLTVTVPESVPGTYTFGLACGSGAHVASAQVTVAFTNDAPAASIQVTATSAVVQRDVLILSWNANVRPCAITFDAPQGDGIVVPNDGSPRGSASLFGQIIGAYTYRIRCGSGATTAEATTVVNWTGKPFVEVNSIPDALRGTEFTVGFNSNIVPCTASGGVAGDGWAGKTFGRQPYGSAILSEQVVGSSSFTVTCGTGAEATSATRTVNILAEAPSGTLTVDKEVQLTGQPVTLTWSSNVGPCRMYFGTPGDGWNGTVAGATGSMTVTEKSPGSYTFRVFCGADGSVLTVVADVNVLYSDFPAPTLTTNKTLAAVGEPVTLTWASPDGSACTADGGYGNEGWGGPRAPSGSAEIKAVYDGITFFSIQCGPSPPIRVKVQFYKVPVVTMTASAGSVIVGEAVTLRWNVDFASSCSAGGGNQTDGWSGALSPSGGSLQVRESVAGTYEYSVNCVGVQTSISASSKVTVTVNASAPPPPPPPSSGGGNSSGGGSGGGGGALGPIDLACYLAVALTLLASRQRRRAIAYKRTEETLRGSV